MASHQDSWIYYNGEPWLASMVQAEMIASGVPVEFAAEYIKTAQPAPAVFADWDESKHPRGQGGRFTRTAEADQRLRGILGHEAPDEDLRTISGTGSNDAVAEASPHRPDAVLVSNEMKDGDVHHATIERTSDGIAITHDLDIKDDADERDFANALAKQLRSAKELGIAEIQAMTSGFKGDYDRSYYALADMGFDAPIPDKTWNAIQEESPGYGKQYGKQYIHTIQDLMDHDPDLWERHGTGTKMKFDPTPGSRSWQAFSQYSKAKKVGFSAEGFRFPMPEVHRPVPGVVGKSWVGEWDYTGGKIGKIDAEKAARQFGLNTGVASAIRLAVQRKNIKHPDQLRDVLAMASSIQGASGGNIDSGTAFEVAVDLKSVADLYRRVLSGRDALSRELLERVRIDHPDVMQDQVLVENEVDFSPIPQVPVWPRLFGTINQVAQAKPIRHEGILQAIENSDGPGDPVIEYLLRQADAKWWICAGRAVLDGNLINYAANEMTRNQPPVTFDLITAACQSILIPKDRFGRLEAEEWCRRHGYKVEFYDSPMSYHRFTQFKHPGFDVQASSVCLNRDDGIVAVLCNKQSGPDSGNPDYAGAARNANKVLKTIQDSLRPVVEFSDSMSDKLIPCADAAAAAVASAWESAVDQLGNDGAAMAVVRGLAEALPKFGLLSLPKDAPEFLAALPALESVRLVAMSSCPTRPMTSDGDGLRLFLQAATDVVHYLDSLYGNPCQIRNKEVSFSVGLPNETCLSEAGTRFIRDAYRSFNRWLKSHSGDLHNLNDLVREPIYRSTPRSPRSHFRVGQNARFTSDEEDGDTDLIKKGHGSYYCSCGRSLRNCRCSAAHRLRFVIKNGCRFCGGPKDRSDIDLSKAIRVVFAMNEVSFDKKWDEDKHPRDHGKFAPKGTVETKVTKDESGPGEEKKEKKDESKTDDGGKQGKEPPPVRTGPPPKVEVGHEIEWYEQAAGKKRTGVVTGVYPNGLYEVDEGGKKTVAYPDDVLTSKKSSTPASSTPASSTPASSTPASSTPASSTPASSTPASNKRPAYTVTKDGKPVRIGPPPEVKVGHEIEWYEQAAKDNKVRKGVVTGIAPNGLFEVDEGGKKSYAYHDDVLTSNKSQEKKQNDSAEQADSKKFGTDDQIEWDTGTGKTESGRVISQDSRGIVVQTPDGNMYRIRSESARKQAVQAPRSNAQSDSSKTSTVPVQHHLNGKQIKWHGGSGKVVSSTGNGWLQVKDNDGNDLFVHEEMLSRKPGKVATPSYFDVGDNSHEAKVWRDNYQPVRNGPRIPIMRPDANSLNWSLDSAGIGKKHLSAWEKHVNGEPLTRSEKQIVSDIKADLSASKRADLTAMLYDHQSGHPIEPDVIERWGHGSPSEKQRAMADAQEKIAKINSGPFVGRLAMMPLKAVVTAAKAFNKTASILEGRYGKVGARFALAAGLAAATAVVAPMSLAVAVPTFLLAEAFAGKSTGNQEYDEQVDRVRKSVSGEGSRRRRQRPDEATFNDVFDDELLTTEEAEKIGQQAIDDIAAQIIQILQGEGEVSESE